MRITELEFTPVSVPYTHRENSSQVVRDGVTSVIVRITASNKLVGWGESCSGADVGSVISALQALRPFIEGRNPWNREAMWRDAFHRGVWNFREPTFNFAWAGIDMALWDLCGRQAGQPLYNLLGGLQRRRVEYFCYLPFGAEFDELREACRCGVADGYRIFYIKVGVDIDRECENVRIIREEIGANGEIRIDANEAWTVAEATRNLARLNEFGIGLAEQPVPAEPVANMLELRARTEVPLAANEGLWRLQDAWNCLKQRAADVLCFSPYWVGSIGHFHRLSHLAALEGLSICKHTHGELGLAAVAAQHVLLTLPRIVDGHQQTAAMMEKDILSDPLPIARQPIWEAAPGPGLGVEVDEEKLEHYARHHDERGQYLPYDRRSLAREDPGWHKI
ncbi:MAG: mandelate racemase/muconate lactonizing enzyme family protein [Candidatus Latescibacterota bacterium]|nr:mandelate racemase/muconate lactonizing enzyme family protein [Candidatus Latescibacterota bacterium]